MDISKNSKRITLYSGHYGSGKTNLAINHALSLRKIYERVAIADLDIVNPYYRTNDARDILRKNDIRLIVSEFANTNVDAPAMPAEAYAVTDDRSSHAVIDVGGDDRGAYALGRYSDRIKEENDYDMYLVINMYRPLTGDVQSTLEIMQEIQLAANIAFTGVINNSNLGYETTPSDIYASVGFAREISRLSGLELKYTGVLDTLYDEVKNEIENAVPISLYVKQSWLK